MSLQDTFVFLSPNKVGRGVVAISAACCHAPLWYPGFKDRKTFFFSLTLAHCGEPQ